MICVSIAERRTDDILRLLPEITFAEIRVDRLADPSEKTIRTLFSAHGNLVATFRRSDSDETARIHTLCRAVENGAAMVDIDVETPANARGKIIAVAKKNNAEIIISHHDYSKTPKRRELDLLISRAKALGADLVKIACMTNTPADAARLLCLLGKHHNIIPVGMGKHGRITRVAAPLLGAPFTYASSSLSDTTAPGQPYYRTLRQNIAAVKNGRVEQ